MTPRNTVGRTTEQADRPSASTGHRRIRRGVAVLTATALVVLTGVGWWAGRQGYVSWFGTACTQEGYDPVPSYEELVSKHHKSPYCARLVRGETWF